MKEKTLDEWLAQHQDEIVSMVEFSKSALPDDFGALHLELSRAQQEVGRAGAFLADVEAYLTQAEAAATMEVRKEYDGLTAGERRAIVKGKIFEIQRLADSLRVVLQALKNKCFACMSLGRSR